MSTEEKLSPEGQFAAALAKAQSQIKGARKDKLNPAFKQGASPGTKYADLAAVWDACRAALTDNGLAVVQKYQFTEAGDHVLCCKLMHVGGHSEESLWPMRPTQNTPQGLGSAGTYARRYTLAAITGVAPDDDDDGNAASERGPLLDEAAQLSRITACTTLAALSAFGDSQIAIDSFDALPPAGQERIKSAAKALRAKLAAPAAEAPTPTRGANIDAWEKRIVAAQTVAELDAIVSEIKGVWKKLLGVDRAHLTKIGADKRAALESPDEQTARTLTAHLREAGGALGECIEALRDSPDYIEASVGVRRAIDRIVADLSAGKAA